ncbi:Collagen Alpha-5(Vi) Chain [Manis pentadactyla]|nr:Collagen Alpha-5(Vi) Chain [Manis pentadactyla]
MWGLVCTRRGTLALGLVLSELALRTGLEVGDFKAVSGERTGRAGQSPQEGRAGCRARGRAGERLRAGGRPGRPGLAPGRLGFGSASGRAPPRGGHLRGAGPACVSAEPRLPDEGRSGGRGAASLPPPLPPPDAERVSGLPAAGYRPANPRRAGSPGRPRSRRCPRRAPRPQPRHPKDRPAGQPPGPRQRAPAGVGPRGAGGGASAPLPRPAPTAREATAHLLGAGRGARVRRGVSLDPSCGRTFQKFLACLEQSPSHAEATAVSHGRGDTGGRGRT